MQQIALFTVGFRAFFAAGTLFSAVAMLIWGIYWQTGMPSALSPVNGMLFWHAHELIMGFGLAIIMGFLLTAVQNWTGLKTAPPIGLMYLLFTWIIARFTMMFGSELPPIAVILICVLPTISTAIFIGIPIIKKQMWRNLFAPIILTLIALMDSALIYQGVKNPNTFPHTLFLLAILSIVLVVVMIGGRVIPFFIGNKLGIKKAEEGTTVFLMCIIPLIILMLTQLITEQLVAKWLSVASLTVLTIGHFLRLKIWHHKNIWQDPMLWSLWLFYACLPVGFFFLAIEPWTPSFSSISLHIITIGSISGIIISMVSRVSLGHTGRVIQHDKWILSAFSLLIMALLVRTVGIAAFGFSPNFVTLSATLWSLSFGIVFIRFLNAWLFPRPDGR
jgi:uncharacterized protein involved in response to NO